MAAQPRRSPHPPSSLGKGGAGGYAPSPNSASVSRGGDTPDYVLFPPSPRTKPRGTLAPPWKIPGSRLLTAAASSPRITARQASCGHTLAGPGWLRPRGPFSPVGLANGGSANVTTCPGLAVAGRTGPGRLGRLYWKGRRGEGAAPMPASLPGVVEPQRSQLAQRCGGLPVPYGSMRYSSA